MYKLLNKHFSLSSLYLYSLSLSLLINDLQFSYLTINKIQISFFDYIKYDIISLPYIYYNFYQTKSKY